MKAKKNEPFSNLGAKTMRVMDKGTSPATPGTETTRTTSRATLVEEIIPQRKRQRIGDKGKDKADSRLSNVWDNVGVALARA